MENNETPNTSDSSEPFYTVKIVNSQNYSIVNPLKSSYAVGEKVTIALETITEHYYRLYVNGMEQSPDESISDDWSVTYYTFTMPAENVIVAIEDVWLEVPDVTQEICQDGNHDWQEVSVNEGCWTINITSACSKCNAEENADGMLVLPNHSWVEEIADGKTTFSCTYGDESITYVSEIGEFSYAQVLENHKIGDPGVKHQSFQNPILEAEISGAIDAIIRAKFELTVEYDTISVSYDEAMDTWCVKFWTVDAEGNSQSVYLNGSGLTTYIVCVE
ncbi:MAG: hypothetical protein E7637_02910 [Ruminococcaceae bacterium]|nr:hypothetical protein [Oscillospiraceae bacterium]